MSLKLSSLIVVTALSALSCAGSTDIGADGDPNAGGAAGAATGGSAGNSGGSGGTAGTGGSAGTSLTGGSSGGSGSGGTAGAGGAPDGGNAGDGGRGMIDGGRRDAGGTGVEAGSAADGGTLGYARNIQPIMALRCTGCHGNDGGLRISYATLVTTGPVTAARANCTFLDISKRRVVPGNADTSFLWIKLSHTTAQLTAAGCGAHMPEGNTALTQAQLDTIQSWIVQGALP